MSTVEAIWVAARDRHGRRVRRSNNTTGTTAVYDRRRPGPGMTAVLLALDPDEARHGGEIARRAGQDQGNTSRWLNRLTEWHFAELVDEIPAAQAKTNRRGGRPARTWALTPTGRELARALRAEVTR